jgi:hypothetical protein
MFFHRVKFILFFLGIDSSETVLIQDNPEHFTYKELLELITPSY